MESLYYGDREVKKIMYGGREIRPEPPKHIELTAVTTASSQTVKINKYFANAHTIDWGDGSPVANHTADTTHTYTTAGTYKIKLTLAGGATRWTFGTASKPLVPTAETTASNINLSKMPSLADYFGANATNPGDYFFYYFNREGALTSLPEGSFNTSNITTVGNRFFSYFNRDGALISLPENSFDTSNITTAGQEFFSYFNSNGALTSLPAGSFDTSNITTVGDRFFRYFNYNGALTSLPAGSFILSQLPVASRNNYFTFFNSNSGKLTKQVGGIQIKNAYTSSVTFHYRNGSSTVSESVSSGNSFNGYTVG